MPLDRTSVMRLGVSPERVFGRLGFPRNGLPLWRYGETDWWSPGFPSWALRSDPESCKVLARAVAKYGVQPLPARADTPPAIAAQPAGATVIDIELADTYLLAGDTATTFAGLRMLHWPNVAPAAPVVYLMRRYGADDFRLSGLGWLSVYASGDLVGVVNTWPADRVEKVAA